MFQQKIHKSLAVLLMMILLAACGGPSIELVELPASDDPAPQFNALNDAVKVAHQAQLDMLSPDWYAMALDSLDRARNGMSQGDAAAKILEDVAYGHTYLEKAKDYARVAKAVIGPAFAARNAAYSVNAMDYDKDFQVLEESFLTLTRNIEDGNIAFAKKNQERVAEGYLLLELRAIKDQALGEVRKTLSGLESKMADVIAPISLKRAQIALEEASSFIDENRYASVQLEQKADAAMFQARRLEQVMTQVSKIKLMKDESIILWVEEILHQTTEKLLVPDMRDRAWNVQTDNIHASISALQNDNKFLQKKLMSDRVELETRLAEKDQEILAQKKQISVLEGASIKAQRERELLAENELKIKKKLEEERLLKMRIVQVRKLFSREQADVYEQEHELVLRLKSISFPVGESFITPDNYNLLSTVRVAIHTFGSPDVIIEGHTDSTGSKEINEKISHQRANAVRAYFVANEAIKPEKIIAIGYGSERPLVKNDTPKGRAVNRRIDVIIRTAE